MVTKCKLFAYIACLMSVCAFIAFSVLKTQVLNDSEFYIREIYLQMIKSEMSRQATKNAINKDSNSTLKNCVILLWVHERLEIDIPQHPLCGGGCEITWNRTRFDEADAVVIEMKMMFSGKDLPDPRKRKPHQIFVWQSKESTWTTRRFYYHTLAEYDNYFNWTMTYRRDSDIDGSMMPFAATPFVSYMMKERSKHDLNVVFSDLRSEMVSNSADACLKSKKKVPTPMPDLTKKDKIAMWMARDCDVTNGAKMRLKLIQNMISHGLNVGGSSACLDKHAKSTFMSTREMYEQIAEHKFYLAFENSYHCKEYITEKLWLNSFYLGTVPVVWGASKEDYIRNTPPNSFIHYEDFDNSKQLVDYLLYLDKNDTAYMEYFEWRKLYPCNYPLHKIDDMFPDTAENNYAIFFTSFCSLCSLLRRETVPSKTVPSLTEYWYKSESKKCMIL